GRGTAALDVEDDGGNLGKIREPDELLHERDARARRTREGAGAVPRGPDDDANRSEFVLRLDDRMARLAGLGFRAETLAVARKRLGKRGRGRDRIPRGDRRAAVDAAEGSGAVAFDEDPVADSARPPDADAERAVELVRRISATHMHRLHVGLQERFLALVLFADQLRDRLGLDLAQRRE